MGYGQLLFCESVAAGMLLLAATAALAPAAAVMAAIGCLVATSVARLRRYPAREWRRGFYGYPGALLGLFAAALFVTGLATWLVLLAASAVAPAATRLAHRILTPLEVPALALPALALTWVALGSLDVRTAAAAVGPGRLVLAVLLAGLGLAVYSRLVAAAAAVGLVIGLAIASRVGPAMDAVLSNSVPAAIALGVVFLPWSVGSVVVASLGAAAAGMAAAVGIALGVPALVAPFDAVVVVTLALLRWPVLRRGVRGLPAPLPLTAIGRPEAAVAHWKARARLAALVHGARRVCVLTGAGVSTAAGLPDVRGPFGLAARTRCIRLADFMTSPELRRQYWQDEERFFRLLQRVSPAAAHRALTDLHRGGRLSAIVTQNVDGLHQAAGMPEHAVIEIHGNLRAARCVDCGWTVPRAELSRRIEADDFNLYCPVCLGLLKGGSVMFDEGVAAGDLDRALQALLASDLLLVLGTSLLVSPAADMLLWARDAGIPIAIVNATPTPYDHQAAVAVAGDVAFVIEDAVAGRPSGHSTARHLREHRQRS